MDCKEFTKKYYVNRKGTDCIKWDSPEAKGKLPMFIADMDFKSDERIIEAIKARVDHGAYGYSKLPKDYQDEVVKWNKRRNGVSYNKDWIRFSKGAVDGLYQVLYALTNEKDAVLITTPVYAPFAATIKTTKRTLVTSSLKKVNGLFTFNYEDIEKKIKEKKVKAIILCSPHNPLGRVWTKDELEKLFAITHKYHVLIISDEVHSDLIMPGVKFTTSLSLKNYQNEIVTLNTASKTFSLAIFNHCHVIIPNVKFREKFDAYQTKNHLQPVNAFNALPTYYGYKYAESWLDDAIKVIDENYKYFVKRLGQYVPIEPLQGTYLIFVDFKKYSKSGYDFLYNKCGIMPNHGESFDSAYKSWARINLGTSLANVKKACDAIETQILKSKKK